MPDLHAEHFPAFFKAVWDREPFAWQTDLARHVMASATSNALTAWPPAIALPTASGKTACMDVAVFALAAQVGRSPAGCRAPRRIFFVVDRRVIVDEAHGRARALAAALAEASDGILHDVAQRLRALAGSNTPLVVQALRGGQPRSDDWAATPLQPTVIASTVDQVGSRLLFRSYGSSSGMWPVHAGLVANDALILLDEAHCAQPMLQTLQAVQRYRGWAEQPLSVPFEVSVLSATPPAEVDATMVFRDTSQEGRDPSHVLGRRQLAAKSARLELAGKAKGRNAALRRSAMAEELARHASALVAAWPADGPGAPAIVVFCNRVDTARQVHARLRSSHSEAHLLTGRMRPIDKEDVVAEVLAPLATARAEGRRLQRATFVVATQTLEVGADLDFDLLVTECASLDALRQRFGRLNRSGRDIAASAVIVAAAHDADGSGSDPVYGDALHRTWSWLNAQSQAQGGVSIDFGIAALQPLLPSGDALAALNAPAPCAPVMLPAHLDAFVQTAPVPEPSPEVSVYLHGPGSGPADVQVCWRADLTSDAVQDWLDVMLRCPPSPPECLAVPYAQAKRWLDNMPAPEGPDVEGAAETDDETRPRSAAEVAPRQALRWFGRDDSVLIKGGSDLRPGDMLVLPAVQGGFDVLGTLGPMPVADWGDRAHAAMRRNPVLRLHPAVVRQWPNDGNREALDKLLTAEAEAEWQEDPASFAKVLQGALEACAAALSDRRWSWLQALVQRAAELPGIERALTPHPCGGWVIQLPPTRSERSGHGLQAAAAFFGDEDDASSSGHFRSLLVDPQEDGHSHLSGVGALAVHYAEGCGLQPDLAAVLRHAGDGHDLGKADPRFQSWLRGGLPWTVGPLLAKSAEMPQGQHENRAARQRAGYPEGGRHELLSVRLLESQANVLLPPEANLRDLLLHLVESHHGHCRPLAPVVVDLAPVDVSVQVGGLALRASSDTRLERLDAGPSDRFWRLTRRYGWWGLAWLECLLRLADHRRSEWEQRHSRGTVT